MRDLIIVTGHYGSGKTNLAVNMATNFAMDERVVLADMDIVNPYFRTADFMSLAEEKGIRLILPPYANTNVDTPIITAEVEAAINENIKLILDVGGDDNGARVLGRFAASIALKTYDMIYVVNCFRPETQTPELAVELLKEIEIASRLRVNYIVYNSNLGEATTEQDIIDSVDYAKKVSKLSGVPILFHSIWNKLDIANHINEELYPVEAFVTAPWK